VAETEDPDFGVRLTHHQRWAFSVDFQQEGVPACVMDESAPLGDQTGPDAARGLAASVADCLSASLLFCLRKVEREPADMETVMEGFMTRNERGHLRVGELAATLRLQGLEGGDSRVRRCVHVFEEHCPVTGSVRQAIPVHVTVTDAEGSPIG